MRLSLIILVFLIFGCAEKMQTIISEAALDAEVTRDLTIEEVAATPTVHGATPIVSAETTLIESEPLMSVVPARVISINEPLTDLNLKAPEFSISTMVFGSDEALDVDETLTKTLAAFDVPITDTPRVQHYLKYFTEGSKSTMQMWLNRSNKYMYLVMDVFKREGVPLDLAVLAFTESGYNPRAYSRAGASGMWQFMRATGKMYNLNVTDWVDERRDFEKSTVAAARHLKDLYGIFDDWYLALAAYNAGSGRISRATKQHKTNDFFTIATGRTLNIETRDYVPKYLAHLLIYKNYENYGFTAPADLPLLYDTVVVPSQANIFVIGQKAGATPEQMQELNPELRTPMTPPKSNYSVRVPLGTSERVLAFINQKDADLTRYVVYQAKAGDEIAKIARTYNVPPSSIKKLNSFNYDKVYTAKILFIPRPGMGEDAIDLAFAKEVAKLAPKYYVVLKGDNLTLISRKHNMPLAALIQLNPKVNPSKIFPGQVLIISQGGLNL